MREHGRRERRMTEQETCSLSKVPLFEYGELSELKVRQKKKSPPLLFSGTQATLK